MSDVPYGYAFRRIRFLGYFGYSQNMRRNVSSQAMLLMRGIQLHSFSVGLEGSPDLAAAQIVADHIGTIHHEIKFTIRRFRRYT
jgi:asparagine synthetase B (glutamine-hydrolysing)